MLKKLWDEFVEYCIIVNTARAANTMARNGHWQEARRLYEQENLRAD